MARFFESFLKPHQELIAVKYFSAIQKNHDKADRQDLFFSANKLNPKFQLHLGKFLKKTLVCRNCQDNIIQYEEKETDVRIATQMITDVVNRKCDITVIVSADSDLIPPIEAIREFNVKHKVWAFFPPQRYSNDLINMTDQHIKLERHFDRFTRAQLPEEVEARNGFILKRPKHWR